MRSTPSLRLAPQAPHIPASRNSIDAGAIHARSAMDMDAASQSLSPAAASHHPNLKLPATCNPPSEHSLPKPKSWIVGSPSPEPMPSTDGLHVGVWRNWPHGPVAGSRSLVAR